jgi:chromosome segregation ATPase
MPEIDLAFLAAQLDRLLKEQMSLRADLAEFRADMEVQSAIIRRMDATMQTLVGEIRVLAGQQDQQRQRLGRHEERRKVLEEQPPVA